MDMSLEVVTPGSPGQNWVPDRHPPRDTSSFAQKNEEHSASCPRLLPRWPCFLLDSAPP